MFFIPVARHHSKWIWWLPSRRHFVCWSLWIRIRYSCYTMNVAPLHFVKCKFKNSSTQDAFCWGATIFAHCAAGQQEWKTLLQPVNKWNSESFANVWHTPHTCKFPTMRIMHIYNKDILFEQPCIGLHVAPCLHPPTPVGVLSTVMAPAVLATATISQTVACRMWVRVASGPHGLLNCATLD